MYSAFPSSLRSAHDLKDRDVTFLGAKTLLGRWRVSRQVRGQRGTETGVSWLEESPRPSRRRYIWEHQKVGQLTSHQEDVFPRTDVAYDVPL